MELSQQSIHDVIHPTAAFSDDNVWKQSATSAAAYAAREIPWEESPLNPKNRIDSLEAPERPLWRIDGCTAFGTQFYAVPLFMESMPPFRIDVFIPEPATISPDLRSVLDMDVAFYTRDASRISQLGVTQHVLRLLQYWTSTMDDPRQIYQNIPFGSRIVFNNLPRDVSQVQVSIAPTYYLERQMLSVSSFQNFWGPHVDLPRTVDIHDVVYLSQLHDSVCLIEYEGKTWIFKALTSYTKYLYHELRQLLSIKPHPNIVARPVHLITKKCSFGSKTAVVGFTLEFHIHGSLRDLIPFLQVHGQVSLADKTKWSVQLASALVHLRETSHIFYPDLRLDNIVLSGSGDVVMVDFEQRGVWCEFAAPEVNAIEYVRLLAIDDEIPSDVRDKYADMLTSMLPGWEEMGQGEDYVWPCEGYNVPWACLTAKEQEACEVYMLGRVLWCIFESNSAPQRAAVWLSYRWEPLVEFPGYTCTPPAMQDLIDRCTRGRQAGLSRLIVRRRDKLVLREFEHTGESTAQGVQTMARDWWAKEIAESETWLKERAEGLKRGDWNENYYDRPSLREVREALEKFRKENNLC
ncbi:tyrosine- kinase, active site [Trichoderma arundinaceum]|uniref:EKC/KEOPS complex subunit BUD32 n=1 Tax=Trichoderma arundinaceum TaxID=490622 RepID=A0A395ND84_TRIAR|nr:tyrosine- kinase, active site [Trichoderma arundinaceum]